MTVWHADNAKLLSPTDIMATKTMPTIGTVLCYHGNYLGYMKAKKLSDILAFSSGLAWDFVKISTWDERALPLTLMVVMPVYMSTVQSSFWILGSANFSSQHLTVCDLIDKSSETCSHCVTKETQMFMHLSCPLRPYQINLIIRGYRSKWSRPEAVSQQINPDVTIKICV